LSRFASKFGGRKSKGNSASWLFVGLGNPGDEYVGTRHNIGSEVVNQIAENSGHRLKKSKYSSLVAGINLDGERIILAFPLTYMNKSGEAVRRLADTFGVSDPGRVVIIHDELDLPVGVVKLKQGGGLAGHNGLKSVNQHLKTKDFVRVRVGIDRPQSSQNVANYVLRKPAKSDLPAVTESVTKAVEACELLIKQGIDKAMVTVNARKN